LGDGGGGDENILAAVIGRDETKTFCVVEELYSAFDHDVLVMSSYAGAAKRFSGAPAAILIRTTFPIRTTFSDRPGHWIWSCATKAFNGRTRAVQAANVWRQG
jgi:hypothetical protein